MNSALDDIIVVLEWLSATKTPPTRVAEAMDRLKKRHAAKIPDDVRSSILEGPKHDDPHDETS